MHGQQFDRPKDEQFATKNDPSITSNRTSLDSVRADRWLLHTSSHDPALVKSTTERFGILSSIIAIALTAPFARAWRCCAIGALLVPLLVSSQTPAPTPTTDNRQPRRAIRVGASIDSYPYSYLDDHGQPTGFVVELLNAVARVMNITVQREMSTGLETNRRFLAGEFDVNQFYSVTPDRLALAQFSVPYLIVNGTIFARRGDTRFQSMEDLRKSHAIVATAGGPANVFGMQHGMSADQFHTTSTEDAIRQVSDGRADAALLSRLSGLAQLHRLRLRNVVPVGTEVSTYPSRFCFAVHRDDEQLLAQLNEGLAILHQTGEFDVIYRRWFSRYEPLAFTRNEVIAYVAAALAVALVVALWGLMRQRQLRRSLASQAAELAHHRTMLAEAQTFAALGHWQRLIGKPDILSWSEETCRVFGRDPSSAPPKTTDQLLEWAGGPDVGRWRDAMERTMRDTTPYDLDLAIEPTAGHRKVIHARGRVVRSENGEVIGLFGTVQDITARRAAEAALRRSERLLRAFYENLPQAVGVVERGEAGWSFVSLNRGAVTYFGLPALPSLPGSLDQLGVSPELQREWTALLTKCETAIAPFSIESRSPHNRRDFVITIVPLGPEVQPLQCYFLVEDITDRKEKDAEIAQGRRLRALGALVGGIAHEFNNLLTPILLKSDELRIEAKDQHVREGISLIADTARRSAELTRRLLAFGRNRTREIELFDVRTVIETNVTLLRQTSDRRIQIESHVPADLPRLYLCANDVHQILLNLLLNARDTLADKLSRNLAPNWQPRISITAQQRGTTSIEPFASTSRRPESWITLCVHDNGMGMPAGVIERVFEPFYTTKEVGRGTGLGLATVWHLISELGGRVDVDSTPGEGSTFCVALPIYPPEPQPPPPKNTHAMAASHTAALRLLVVDDEPVISKLVSTLLRRQGHQLVLVQQGQEAWEHISKAPRDFDALIMDLNMPGLSGLEVARRARQLGFNRPILVMSGHVTTEDRRELERLGITSIIQKPFSAEDFTTAFARFIVKS